MQRTTIFALSSILLLSACGNSAVNTSAGDNPLLQIQHDEQLADLLANLIIQKDPLADDAATRKMLESEITKTKESLAATQRAQASGISGPMRSEKEDVQGWALYMNDTLYTSSDFASKPGLDLHLYLTTVVDPRDVVFPDITSIDLGRIDYPFGAMALPVHAKADAAKNLRSVILWDVKLKRLYGFAQLSARQ